MIVKKECDYAKELGEALELVVGIVRVIKEKGDYTSLLPALVAAVEGVTEIPNEVKDLKATLGTTGYSIGEIVDIFTAKE